MIMYTTGIIVFVLIALALIEVFAWRDGILSLCFSDACPSGEDSGPFDILIIEIVGIIGGGFAAIHSIVGSRGALDPYGLHVAQALLKAVLGGLTAILGVLLLHASDVIVIEDPVRLLVFALVFGYSQELVTRLISNREEELLKSALPEAQIQPS
ncbi:hypothetical protein OHA61_10010 [Streptomyces sp. NBC_00885]|uniref:hypothetical protein n=1 Tax=Streptomyces sp. NBC_00885 TaxID=2975857 RepID=UPI0038653C6D|nr:hypothetical protein OHA61_10010 [Streptomyces sp. NBC_00885]